jgi:hypothetical protein
MLSLRSITKVKPVHWMLLVLAILLLEYLTGPYIQFFLLLIFPVALATAGQGRPVGVSIAVVLPLLRLPFYAQWPLPASWTFLVADTATDILILVASAWLIDRLVRQDREIRILEGLLPICSFCKRIRDERGEWRQLETYIASRSAARFSHTFCSDCGRREYPGQVS